MRRGDGFFVPEGVGNADRIALINSEKWHYWTRSPNLFHSLNLRYVSRDGELSYDGACLSDRGVRPALNLKSNTLVSAIRD